LILILKDDKDLNTGCP